MSQSQKMKNALIKYVVPTLTEKGFVGKYPHFKKIYNDRIELLVFQTNKWGNSFTVEISTVFLSDRRRNNNFCSGEFEEIENATVWDTNRRYRLKGMYDGWFYYTDVYKQKIKSMTIYNTISESKAENYTPEPGEILIQKADKDIYKKICDEVNLQMKNAFKWWEAFNKNNKLKLKLLEL